MVSIGERINQAAKTTYGIIVFAWNRCKTGTPPFLSSLHQSRCRISPSSNSHISKFQSGLNLIMPLDMSVKKEDIC